jgi:hypothetical protein
VFLGERSGSYETASAPTEGTVVTVRFVADARAADITKFLDSFKASMVNGPRAGGFFRLRVANRSRDELPEVVSRMSQEKIVEFAAVVQ